jgi:sugar-specific transcriptional regulator TrmB
MVCPVKQINVTNPKSLQGKSLEGVGVLVGLGLSERQAQVYLALLKSGGGRAKIVSGLTGISRQDVYRLFAELLRLGLVRQNLTVPVCYSALPFTEAAGLLLKLKTDDLIATTKKATQLAKKLNQTPAPAAAEPKACFGEVFEDEHGKRYLCALQGAEGCVELVVSWVRFRQLCFHFEGALKNAVKRGVKVRVAVEQPPPRHRFPKWVGALDGSVFELRTMLCVPAVALAVFDGGEVAVAFESTAGLAGGPDLWSRHGGLVAVCRGYFDGLWAALK